MNQIYGIPDNDSERIDESPENKISLGIHAPDALPVQNISDVGSFDLEAFEKAAKCCIEVQEG